MREEVKEKLRAELSSKLAELSLKDFELKFYCLERVVKDMRDKLKEVKEVKKDGAFSYFKNGALYDLSKLLGNTKLSLDKQRVLHEQIQNRLLDWVLDNIFEGLTKQSNYGSYKESLKEELSFIKYKMCVLVDTDEVDVSIFENDLFRNLLVIKVKVETLKSLLEVDAIKKDCKGLEVYNYLSILSSLLITLQSDIDIEVSNYRNKILQIVNDIEVIINNHITEEMFNMLKNEG